MVVFVVGELATYDRHAPAARSGGLAIVLEPVLHWPLGMIIANAYACCQA